MIRFFSWLQQPDRRPSLWDRYNILEYISSLAESRAARTGGLALVEALRFSRFALGIPIPDEILQDVQIKGGCNRLALEAPQSKSARPLTVAEVARLENAMVTDLDVIDKYLIGGIIFAIFSRSRWSDLRYVDQLWIDRQTHLGEPFVFVEAVTQHHKTATALMKKQKRMPLVAPVLGVTHVDWSGEWLKCMHDVGVDMDTVPFGAICRAPREDRSIGVRSCSSDEIGKFVTKFLGCSEEDRITSHSFKHATLMWSSSYGMEENARTLLGHHELQGKPLAVYSRDMLTRPLQLYSSMLMNIRLGHFRPDQSRTTRLLDLMQLPSQPSGLPPAISAASAAEGDGSEAPLEAEDPKQNLMPDDDDEGVESASSSSSSESSEESSRKPEGCDIPGPVWLNKRSHVVHRYSNVSGSAQCGRHTNVANFVMLLTGCSSLNARCGVCFKGEIITTREQMAAHLEASRAKKARRH